MRVWKFADTLRALHMLVYTREPGHCIIYAVYMAGYYIGYIIYTYYVLLSGSHTLTYPHPGMYWYGPYSHIVS